MILSSFQDFGKYEIVLIEVKVQGVIAKQNIKAGELILSEEQLLHVSASQELASQFSFLAENPLKKLFDSLSPKKKAIALKFHSARGLKSGEAGLETDVIKTKALPCERILQMEERFILQSAESITHVNESL